MCHTQPASLQSFFAERFFCLFDSDKSGSIEMEELMNGLQMLTNGTPKQKLKFLFDVYDVDGKEPVKGGRSGKVNKCQAYKQELAYNKHLAYTK